MIFPGMDPYLENPYLWPGVQTVFMVYLAEKLTQELHPRYRVNIQRRVFYETPLLEIHDTYLVIMDRQTDKQPVTVINLVSPPNKTNGPGREAYLADQKRWLKEPVNLMEIDLLRGGEHTLALPIAMIPAKEEHHYLAAVRCLGPEHWEIYPMHLRQRLPQVRLPLGHDDGDAVLELQSHLTRTLSSKHLSYGRPCVPALVVDDQAWADQLIQQARQAGSQETR